MAFTQRMPRPTIEVQMPCAGGGKGRPRPRHPSFVFVDRCSSPTRRAAKGDRALCTPGPGLRPWEPRFDVCICRAFDVHAYGRTASGS